MNKTRTNFDLTVNHVRVTPYWLLGLIGGEMETFYYKKAS